MVFNTAKVDVNVGEMGVNNPNADVNELYVVFKAVKVDVNTKEMDVNNLKADINELYVVFNAVKVDVRRMKLVFRGILWWYFLVLGLEGGGQIVRNAS